MAQIYNDKFANLLSQIAIDSTNYSLKDAAVRAILDTYGDIVTKNVAATITETGKIPTAEIVKNYVDTQLQTINKFDVQIYQTLPTAGANTMYILGLVADNSAEAGAYIEYITIRTGEEGNYAYTWEAIGSTKTDLTDYLTKAATVAGVAFGDDKAISIVELSAAGALDLKALAHKDSASGSIDTADSGSATVKKVTGISVTLKDAAADTDITSTGTFTPSGDVAATPNNSDGAFQVGGTNSSSSVTVNTNTDTIQKVTSVGTPTEVTTAEKTVAGAGAFKAEVDGTNETLRLTSIQNITFKAVDTVTAGTAPTLAATGTTVVTGILSATAAAQTFTGNKYDLGFTGTQGNVSVSGNYKKQVVDTASVQDEDDTVAVTLTKTSKTVTVS